jgi:hypothetical protein
MVFKRLQRYNFLEYKQPKNLAFLQSIQSMPPKSSLFLRDEERVVAGGGKLLFLNSINFNNKYIFVAFLKCLEKLSR